MLKAIALVGFVAALTLPSASALAVSGDSSSYGSEGLARPFRRSR
jgi:hypothetical protein